MLNKFFITGTDTGIGKTYVSVSLLNAFKQLGYSTLGIKPVSSGCVKRDGVFYNEDALALQQASSISLDYALINPFAFEPPIAPNLAAARVNTVLSVKTLVNKTSYALHYPADIHLVEGVGGWQVPLNNHETMADFAIQSKLRIILVVGIRLGCLNHAILTYNALKNSHAPLAGWIANCFQPHEPETALIIATLKKWLKIPCLSVVDYQGQIKGSDLWHEKLLSGESSEPVLFLK